MIEHPFRRWRRFFARPAPEAAPPAADALIVELLRERRANRRRRWLRRLGLLALAAALVALYFPDRLDLFGPAPDAPQIGVVRLRGPVGPEGLASADRVVKALDQAFSAEAVKAVALVINSPGGDPFEAERIGAEIERRKALTGKPVYAFIEELGASAAYLVAIHADRIVAGRYSLTGSIGAILTGWDFHAVLDRFGIRQRVYASGAQKAMLNPFVPASPESKAKAEALVRQAAGTFLADVRRLRGGKLKDGVDYATGEVWTGEEALRLGLVDALGTLDRIAAEDLKGTLREFGPEDPMRAFRPLASAAGLLIGAALDALAWR